MQLERPLEAPADTGSVWSREGFDDEQPPDEFVTLAGRFAEIRELSRTDQSRQRRHAETIPQPPLRDAAYARTLHAWWIVVERSPHSLPRS